MGDSLVLERPTLFDTRPYDESWKRDMARAWLEHVRGLRSHMLMMRMLYETECELADGLTGIDYSRDKVDVSPTDEGILKSIERIAERRDAYRAAVEAYSGERADAQRLLESMADTTESDALIGHYLLGMEWYGRIEGAKIATDGSVARALCYTPDGIDSLKNRALLHAYDVMPPEWKAPKAI